MTPTLPLDGRIYTLTAGRVLNTNVLQINLGKLLFRATLKVRLTAFKMDNLDHTKINAHFKNSQLVYRRAHSRVLAYIASPTSPPYVVKQLTALFHTQPLLKYLVYSIEAPMVNCVF